MFRSIKAAFWAARSNLSVFQLTCIVQAGKTMGRNSGEPGDGDGGGDGGGGGVNIYRAGGSTGAAVGGGGREGENTLRVPAKRIKLSYSNTAPAAYAWGTQARKGGVREKFVATFDAADMVKVRAHCQDTCTRQTDPVCLRGTRLGLGSPVLVVNT